VWRKAEPARQVVKKSSGSGHMSEHSAEPISTSENRNEKSDNRGWSSKKRPAADCASEKERRKPMTTKQEEVLKVMRRNGLKQVEKEAAERGNDKGQLSGVNAGGVEGGQPGTE